MRFTVDGRRFELAADGALTDAAGVLLGTLLRTERQEVHTDTHSRNGRIVSATIRKVTVVRWAARLPGRQKGCACESRAAAVRWLLAGVPDGRC